MPAPPVVLHICRSCSDANLRALQGALAVAKLPAPVRVVPEDCINGSARPVSLALQSPGRATCFFSGVNPVVDASDIVATVRAYLDAPAGWIADARMCGRLRVCLVARVPALSSRS